MASRKIQPRVNGPSKHQFERLNTNQRAFVIALLANEMFNPTEAAREVGYKNPTCAAQRLMKNKVIQAALGKAQREREERCQLKADDVLNYLRIALFYDPLEFFTPDGKGKWTIKDPKDLPLEVKRLIEKIEVKVTTKDDGTEESYFKLELVSKTVALGLAMKHTTVDKTQVQHTLAFPFDMLHTPTNGEVDPVQQQIKDASK